MLWVGGEDWTGRKETGPRSVREDEEEVYLAVERFFEI